MLSSSSFSSFSQEDHSKLRSSERSCFLEGSEASFVPCDKDLEPLVTQEVASAHQDGPCVMFCDDLFHYLQNRIIRKRSRRSQANDELKQYINPELAISYRLCVLRNIFLAMQQ